MKQRFLYGIDLLVYLYVTAVLRLALIGGFELSVGPLRISAHSYTNLLVALGGLLALRRWLRGSATDGFRIPLCSVVNAFKRSPAVISSSARAFLTAPWFPAGVLLAAALLAGILAVVILTPYPLQGLTGRYFDNPDWSGSPVLTVRDRELSLRRVQHDWYEFDYGIEWTGVIYIARAGDYRFVTESDDGSLLWIDDELVVDNGGAHGTLRREGVATLADGFHAIRLRYMQQQVVATLAAAWSSEPTERATRGERPLSTAVLFPERPSSRSFALFRLFQGFVAIVELLLLVFFSVALLGGCDLLLDMRRTSSRLSTLDAFGSLRAYRDTATYAVAGLRRRFASSVSRTALVVAASLTVVLLGLVGLGADLQQGLTGRYYDNPDWTGDLLATARDRELNLRRTVYDFINNEEFLYSVEWSGVIHIPTAGDYRFALTSEGGSRLWIGDTLVVDNSDAHVDVERAEGVARLTAGLREIRVRYAHAEARHGTFFADWSRGSEPMRRLSTAALFPEPPTGSAWAWFRLSWGLLEIVNLVPVRLRASLLIVAGLVLLRLAVGSAAARGFDLMAGPRSPAASGWRRPGVLLNGLLLVSFAAYMVALARKQLVFGSEAGNWLYPYVQDATMQAVLVGVVAAGLAICGLRISLERVDRRPALVVGCWLLGAFAFQLVVHDLYPETLGGIIESDIATSFYGAALMTSPAELLARFEELRLSLPLHASSNMPGKTLLFHFLLLFSRDPAVIALLVVGLSNLGCVLLYLVAREWFDDRRTALLALALGLLFPAYVGFLPLLNTLVPAFLLLPLWLWLLYLRRGGSGLLVLLGANLYLLLMFEPLPFVGGLIFLAALLRYGCAGKVGLRQLVEVCVWPLAGLLAAHFAALFFFHFDSFAVFVLLFNDAADYNLRTERAFHVWIFESPKEFFFGVGLAPTVLFLLLVQDGARRLLTAVHGDRQAGALRRLMTRPDFSLLVGLTAVLLFVVLLGVDRGEVSRVWIFLAMFLQLLVAHAAVDRFTPTTRDLLAATLLLQTAVTVSMVGYVQP